MLQSNLRWARWLGPEAWPVWCPGLQHWLLNQGKEKGGTAGSQAVPTSHRSTQKEEKPLLTDRAYQGLARDGERATAPQPLCWAELAAETRGHSPPQHFLPSVYSTGMVTNWRSVECLVFQMFLCQGLRVAQSIWQGLRVAQTLPTFDAITIEVSDSHRVA